jgi:glycosyltransferase involved in cell wall biosynthesis
MRILVVTPTFLPVMGGAEMVLFEVYRRLAVRHEVRLLAAAPAPGLLRDHSAAADAPDVPFAVAHYRDRVSLMRVRGHRWTGGAIPPFSLSAVAAVRAHARAFRPDVVNVHYAMPTGLAAVVADRGLGIPTVLTMNGRDVPGPGVPVLWRRWQRALLALVTDATYVSGYCRDAIYGDRPARGRVVYNGVELPAPPGDGAALRRAHGIDAEAPLIFALQRLAPEKRVDVLLGALRRCRDLTGAGTLLIAGQGPEGPALRRRSEELGVAAHVRFAGYVPRAALPAHFTACDLFAFHSTFETFGLVVAQAMSYGRAVVTVRNTALPEIVGDAGVLVPTGDGRAFGDALAALVADRERRVRLGETGRARAAALFDWDDIARQYETVLARAAGARARPAVVAEPRS